VASGRLLLVSIAIPFDLERVRSAFAGAGQVAYAYPDTDSQMENGVFSFAKREDERLAWEELVGQADPRVALDVGCGLGNHVGPLRARFRTCFFVDPDPRRLAAAARKFGEEPGKWFFNVAIEDVDLPDTFTFVQAVQVLGHLPRLRAERLMTSMARMMRPGALLLIGVPFTGQPFDVFVSTYYEPGMDKPMPHPVSPQRFDALADHPEEKKLPVRHFSMGTIHSLAATAGLSVVETRPYHWFDELTGDLFALLRK
jgi:SAM-dependent methyltransferase